MLKFLTRVLEDGKVHVRVLEETAGPFPCSGCGGQKTVPNPKRGHRERRDPCSRCHGTGEMVTIAVLCGGFTLRAEAVAELASGSLTIEEEAR